MTEDPSVDGPTAMNPSSGHLAGDSPDEPTLAEPTQADNPPAGGSRDEPTIAEPVAMGGGAPRAQPPHPTAPAGENTIAEPVTERDGARLAQPPHPAGPAGENTVAEPVAMGDGAPLPHPPHPATPAGENTVAEPVWTGWPSNAAFSVDGPTVAEPAVAESAVVGDDETTRANEDPTTTGPTVGGWPLDQFEPPPPGELIWQPDSVAVAPPATGRRPAYYVLLGAAVVLVVGLVAFAALVTVRKPTEAVAGTGRAAIPIVTSSSQPPTSSTSTSAPPANPYADLAEHPLSTDTTRMPDVTCALPRFDLPDDRQAAFFQAAKVCADDAWRPVLAAAGLDDVQVQLVTVTGPAQTPCGDLAPNTPPTSCEGTVYMTPAYLRDTEQLGRYPGKYLGVFLREYARAVQFGAGLDQAASSIPNGSADIDTRLDQQATCLAGAASGAMAGRGDVDDNITGEIRQRLSSVDAPPDAESLLDKGFQQRTPAACNTWTK